MTRRAFVLTAAILAIAYSPSVASAQATHLRWDIINVTGGINPGGFASATANDGSMITVTGTGTFVAPGGGGGSNRSATGGGSWQTFDSAGTSTGTGTYQVTGLVRWELGPGALPGAAVDNIGSPADARAGLAVFEVEYSDGSRGVLMVSCRLPVGGASIMPEGINATKAFVNYFQVLPPVAAVEGNRTLYHVLK